jgi:DNA-binding response OmpR family regulator
MSLWNKKIKKRRSLRKQVEALKKAKLASGKVVKLSDFRELDEVSRPETILVVDDDEVIRNGLTRILEGEGYHVIVAEDGMELSKVLESVAMDLILLDVHLPWVDGFELCSLIKGHDLFKGLPLILISASKTEEDLKKGFASGCDDYICKPFNIERLIETVDKSLL